MLDDGVALVAADHAQLEEAGIFPEHQAFEEAAVIVAVILRRLHEAHHRVGELRHHAAQPVGFDDVVAIQHADDLGVRGGLAQAEVQRAGFEAFVFAQVEEAEFFAQPRAMLRHRLPEGRVHGVVVDHQHFEIG